MGRTSPSGGRNRPMPMRLPYKTKKHKFQQTGKDKSQKPEKSPKFPALIDAAEYSIILKRKDQPSLGRWSERSKVFSDTEGRVYKPEAVKHITLGRIDVH